MKTTTPLTEQVARRLITTVLILAVTTVPLNAIALVQETPTGWLSPGDPEITFNELPASYQVPYSYNYNTDCATRDFDVIIREAKMLPYPYNRQQAEQRHASECAVQTPRGMHDGYYLDAGVPAGKFTGHSGFVALVPNSNVLIAFRTTVASIAMEVSLFDAVVPQYNAVTGEVQYNLTGHRYLTDGNGDKIFLRPGSIGYSSDGRWMVADSSFGFVRVDLETKAIVPFARGLTYDTGSNPTPRVAISPDGRYAAFASRNTLFRVYDLDTCADVPLDINGPVSCQYKDIEPLLSEKFRTYDNSYYIRFASSELLTFITAYTDQNGESRRVSVRMAPNGQEIENATYLALGDSFSSGEGAYAYELGTDEPENNCHLSVRSYPYLLAQSLVVPFRSVACSGALMADYQYPQSDRDSKKSLSSSNTLGLWLPGPKPQREFLRMSDSSQALTISISGNDIGFSDKIAACISVGTCRYAGTPEGRSSVAREIAGLYKPLKQLYEQIIEDTKGKTKIYAIGYPQIVANTNLQCDSNVHLNGSEIAFARQATTYINQVIQAAADAAGVYYVDIEGALEGSNLCSGNANSVNGLTAGDDITLAWWQKLPAKVVAGSTAFGNESYHPNAKGHGLMAAAISHATGGTIVDFNICPDSPAGTVVCPKSGVQIPSPDESYFGADASRYVFCLNNTSSCGLSDFEKAMQKLNGFIVEPEDPATDLLLRIRMETKLKPGTEVKVELRSEPTILGTFTADQYGTVDATVTIPNSVPAGYHTLHLLGQNIAGEKIDYYQPVLVTGEVGDVDGDGIPDVEDPCGFVTAANIDQDRDGIDDACDAEITEAPADSVAPIVTGVPDREPNEHGWYNSDVTINWTSTDPDPSSGTPTQPPATVANLNGINTYTSEQSCDPLGNCAEGSLELKIDKTAPDITFALDPLPTATGWNNSEVTVTFTCTDADSGVDQCTEPQTVSGTDGTFVITGTVTDKAGNSNGVNVFVSLDRAAPVLTQTIYPAANSSGWHDTDVTISTTCEDVLSGVLECSQPLTISDEGAGQIAASAATDNAGNTASKETAISIDKTAPVLGSVLWSGNPKSVIGMASVVVPASDNLSGIAEAEYYLGDTDPGVGNGATMQLGEDSVSVDFSADFPTGVYKVTVRAKDKAGNWSVPVSDYLVVYDPFGTRMTGKRTLVPSLIDGDILPGLISYDQAEGAKFGFNVRYDKDNSIHKHSDFQFEYKTGEFCNKPAKAVNCHVFELDATSIAWLTTQGQNDSTGIFQGVAKLQIDDASSADVLFRLTGLDGERLDAGSQDHLTLKIYAANVDPNTAQPLYQVDADVSRGNIKIRKM